MTQAPRYYSRGYIPHFDGGEIPQFVTLRLHGSLPVELWARWKQELELARDETAKRELRTAVEYYLDQGHGPTWLNQPEVATVVKEALLYRHEGKIWTLHAWVIMPNHVHFLVTPASGRPFFRVIQSFKSYCSKEANVLLQRCGPFWQRDYFDRFVRDEKHFFACVEYIENNPVKAGLCTPGDVWLWGSSPGSAERLLGS